MIVIPAVDIKGGKCVRLWKGLKDRETIYDEDPLRAAARWAREPVKRIHIIDLDGAFEGRPRNMDKIIEIVRYLRDPGIECEIGGGVRTVETVREYADAGAARVVVGTIAAREPDLFRSMALSVPGIVNLGLDCRGEEVLVKGWEVAGGVKLFDLLASTADLPLGEVIYTEVERDGTGGGIADDWLRRVVAESPHPVIASGGVGSIDDIRQAKDAGAFGVIVGRALYTGDVDLAEALAMEA
ncbi:MAG: 1-(5-phosphoribosyl)-5-[(5-phosphoribosylamino)methylideneamino]imidazole-4-carboxamide isomerase [Planctomycetes bacterium]|nr:1-(5-phosphoribosyl)-5-[(5-phosphoribosylamino)methylideneamino]imidazole-4-carboxamide isomerase [Planctomycetota bacterium]